MDADCYLHFGLMNSPTNDEYLTGRNSASSYGIWAYQIDYFNEFCLRAALTGQLRPLGS